MSFSYNVCTILKISDLKILSCMALHAIKICDGCKNEAVKKITLNRSKSENLKYYLHRLLCSLFGGIPSS